MLRKMNWLSREWETWASRLRPEPPLSVQSKKRVGHAQLLFRYTHGPNSRPLMHHLVQYESMALFLFEYRGGDWERWEAWCHGEEVSEWLEILLGRSYGRAHSGLSLTLWPSNLTNAETYSRNRRGSRCSGDRVLIILISVW